MGPEVGRLLGDDPEPFRVLLEEQRGAVGVEAGPHERIAAQPKHEEVGGAVEALEHVEGYCNLGKRLLRDNLQNRRDISLVG